MSKADLTENLLSVFQPIAGSLKVDGKALVSADNAAEIEQIRQALAELATSVRSIDDGAIAFRDCVVSSSENGTADSICPGFTPFGPVEDSKRKSTASNQKSTPLPRSSRKSVTTTPRRPLRRSNNGFSTI
jgi:hypothetical protein